ncbi:MAG: ribosome small subunit-dependent GTPase A [Candidatus Riflebacteria bacterium HGW-Riflebacteria-1]|jgi:ribosome biogenesis GTPase|nr:MAG: ribosome small subunit-dependent GTPase A [Candidatus Riflebacteria bacterium HGW-Riflebacteria-1]
MHTDLKNFGFGFFQEQHRIENEIAMENVARVISDSHEIYLLQTSQGVCRGSMTGKMRYNAAGRRDLPAVGDWVVISRPDAHNAVIEALFPRRTDLCRSAVQASASSLRADVQIIAANIDTAFIVVAVDRDFSINRIDRYMSLILQGGAIPVVLLNKCDLIDEETWKSHENQLYKRHPGVEVIATSLITGQGLELLAKATPSGQTCCFIGSSGVGKSSLINYLAGEEMIATAQISAVNARGRHTTTSRHLHLLPSGALLLDTPGMREVAMSDAESGVSEAFSFIEEVALKCRFTDCRHVDEPGCAIMEAIESGHLDYETLASYKKLLRESARFEKKINEQRKSERSFGKMVKEVLKVKKQLRGY